MNNLLDQLHAALLSRNGTEIIRIAEQIDGEYQGGKIVELPCRVGDVLYWRSRFGNAVHQGKVYEIKISSFGFDLDLRTAENQRFLRESEKCYSTREAAEQALKERET